MAWSVFKVPGAGLWAGVTLVRPAGQAERCWGGSGPGSGLHRELGGSCLPYNCNCTVPCKVRKVKSRRIGYTDRDMSRPGTCVGGRDTHVCPGPPLRASSGICSSRRCAIWRVAGGAVTHQSKIAISKVLLMAKSQEPQKCH